MSRTILLMTVVICGLGLVGTSAFAEKKAPKKEGLRAFNTIQQVLQHPRCQNCHIPEDAPLQFDQGIPHRQNVQRGVDGRGMAGQRCDTCHTVANSPKSYGPNAPPGAPNWHLPPANQKMVFIHLSGGELCRVLKNPVSNGGKNMDALLEHVSHDKLVLWGWNPGGTRAPVPVPHEQFVAEFKVWMAAGAPCPDIRVGG